MATIAQPQAPPAPTDDYQRYERALAGVEAPLALVDMDAFWQNGADMLRRAGARACRVGRAGAAHGGGGGRRRGRGAGPRAAVAGGARRMTAAATARDRMGLQAAHGKVQTDQERDALMRRYHDGISSF